MSQPAERPPRRLLDLPLRRAPAPTDEHEARAWREEMEARVGNLEASFRALRARLEAEKEDRNA